MLKETPLWNLTLSPTGKVVKEETFLHAVLTMLAFVAALVALYFIYLAYLLFLFLIA